MERWMHRAERHHSDARRSAACGGDHRGSADCARRQPLRRRIVIVDDGSSDGSADVARASVDGQVSLSVVRRNGDGRFEARRAGLEVASGELALLLEPVCGSTRMPSLSARSCGRRARVERSCARRIRVGVGTFWGLLAELAWRDYFDNPRTTSLVRGLRPLPQGNDVLRRPKRVLLGRSPRSGRAPEWRLATTTHRSCEPSPRARASDLAALRLGYYRARIRSLPRARDSSWDGLRRRSRDAEVPLLPGSRGLFPPERGADGPGNPPPALAPLSSR